MTSHFLAAAVVAGALFALTTLISVSPASKSPMLLSASTRILRRRQALVHTTALCEDSLKLPCEDSLKLPVPPDVRMPEVRLPTGPNISPPCAPNVQMPEDPHIKLPEAPCVPSSTTNAARTTGSRRRPRQIRKEKLSVAKSHFAQEFASFEHSYKKFKSLKPVKGVSCPCMSLVHSFARHDVTVGENTYCRYYWCLGNRVCCG